MRALRSNPNSSFMSRCSAPHGARLHPRDLRQEIECDRENDVDRQQLHSFQPVRFAIPAAICPVISTDTKMAITSAGENTRSIGRGP